MTHKQVDENTTTVGDILETMNDEQKNLLYVLCSRALDGSEPNLTLDNLRIYYSLDEWQKKVFMFLIGEALAKYQNNEGLEIVK